MRQKIDYPLIFRLDNWGLLRSLTQLRSDKAYTLIALKVEKDLQIHISSVTDPLIVCYTAVFSPDRRSVA